MTDDRTRRSILARRARFVTAALAAIGVGACGGEIEPQVCLEPVVDAGADTVDTGPGVCLSPEPPDTAFADTAEADAVDDGATEDGATDTSDDTGPVPCLAPPLDGG